MRKYNQELYCRINKDDFIVMTRHKNVITEYFCPKEGYNRRYSPLLMVCVMAVRSEWIFVMQG